MTTRSDIVAKAREYLGTPFRHQGRMKGVGLDCAGLLVCVFREFGVPIEDVTGYAVNPQSQQLEAALSHHRLVSVRKQDAKPGDIYLIRYARENQHLAIATDRGMLHAFNRGATRGATRGRLRNEVVEHAISGWWWSRITAVYHCPVEVSD